MSTTPRVDFDYAHARYYANKQGRFTSGDPLMSSAKPTDPQSWNRYTYCFNNPVALTDPTGMEAPRGPDARFMAGFRGASGSGDMQVFEGTQYTNGEVPGGYAEVVAYGIFGSQIASSTDLRSEWLFGQHIEA